jgi:hypothetical protein
MNPSHRRPVKRAIVGALGGVGIIAGVFLPWLVSDGFTVGTVSVSKEVAGADVEFGGAAIAAGAVAVVSAVLLLIAPQLRRVWAVLLLVAGLAAVAVAVMTWRDMQTKYIDVALTEAGVPADERSAVRTSLESLFETGVGVEPGAGLFLALAGGAVTAIAGVASVSDRSRKIAGSHASAESRSMAMAAGAGSSFHDVSAGGAAGGRADREPEPEDEPAAEPEAEGEPAPRRPLLGDSWSA